MRRDLLPGVMLYLVTDSTPRSGPVEEFLARVIEAGVGMVQLRERRLGDRELLRAARAFSAVCRDNGALFVVNDRVDIAVLAGADGVHIGQSDVHAEDVRRLAGEDFIIGLSSHSRDEFDAAHASAADYVGVGPVFETPTKPGRPAVGLELVQYAAARASKPFFAIGGIGTENVARVRAAGAKAISVVRAISDVDDPDAAVRELLASMASPA